MKGREMPKAQPWDIVKSKIQVKIVKLEKSEDEDKKNPHKVIDTIYTTMSGKEFRRSMELDYADGEDNRIEIVSEAPSTFKMNCIYLRADGKAAWVYVD